MERGIFTITVDGRDYFGTLANDGWPTGPCPSAEEATLRVEAYERGDEVDEAAPQQLSRRQMTTVAQWAAENGFAAEATLAAVARSEGLHSEAWIRASAAFEILIGQWNYTEDGAYVWIPGPMPKGVWDVGGARIRSAIGEASLMRGETGGQQRLGS